MSGIVGGAGSKSGVIGTTELDYEEGTWTPTFNGFSGSTTVQGAKYTKIGRQVFCECEVTFATNSDGDRIEISLPLTSTNKGGGFLRWTDVGSGINDGIFGHVSSATIYWFNSSGGFYTYSNFSGDRLDFVAVFLV